VNDCDFCKIVRGEEPAQIVYEDELCLAFFPLEPAARGHTLVIPREHVTDFWSVGEETASSVIKTCVRVARGIREALDPEGLNIINQTGEAAHQTVFHLHFHVVPRWSSDRLKVIWPPPSKYVEESLDEVAAEIRKAIAAIDSP
jgi:histidine triad (HIT) family protein